MPLQKTDATISSRAVTRTLPLGGVSEIYLKFSNLMFLPDFARRHHGWCRAKCFENLKSLYRRKWRVFPTQYFNILVIAYNNELHQHRKIITDY